MTNEKTQTATKSTPTLDLLTNSSEKMSPEQWILRLISMAEQVKHPGTTPSDLARELVVEQWLITLSEIGEERFDAALMHVMGRVSHFPKVSDIRRAAGLNPRLLYPIEKEAEGQLLYLIDGMRGPHGPTLQPISINIHSCVEDKTKAAEGSACTLDQIALESTPFTLTTRTELALVRLGLGNINKGISLIAEHSSLPWNLRIDKSRGDRMWGYFWKIDDILERWIDCYRKVDPYYSDLIAANR